MLMLPLSIQLKFTKGINNKFSGASEQNSGVGEEIKEEEVQLEED